MKSPPTPEDDSIGLLYEEGNFFERRFYMYRDIVGHAVAVTGGPGLWDEVIADVHCYKTMCTLIQEFGVLCCLTTPGLRKDIRRQIR